MAHGRIVLPAAVLAALLLPAAAGCGGGDGTPAAPAATVPAKHEHRAPHGGTLVELGEEAAHLEIVVDRTTGLVTGYSLDGEAEEAVPLAQGGIEILGKAAGREFRVVLAPVANPLTGEKAGATSQFSAACEALRGVDRWEGRVTSVETKGTTFSGVAFRFPEGNEGGGK